MVIYYCNFGLNLLTFVQEILLEYITEVLHIPLESAGDIVFVEML